MGDKIRKRGRGLAWIAALLVASAQISLPQATTTDADNAKKDLDSCRIHEVKGLPGSHEFGSDFIEAIAGDPNPKSKDRNAVWALTADLSSKVPAPDRVLYISKSADGGKTWVQVARVDSRYFDADIGEGERNGLSVAPGWNGIRDYHPTGGLSGFPAVGCGRR